ncbi:acylphosphatase [Novosphingobium marinum]|uniref:acylphosphatase n=1 Tax=Novosphingobium marinum TaxID=1514948 RepID=A0A7Y9XTT7_9SPHN|nr:acylphosphatase [Novosphingobium marinum]NYH94347.1 acylphosphatase [Novosphingobium marinum]GGC21634.1 acylphosphatase [Novosphingobium marinum]
MVARLLTVRGRVQGVFYRDWTVGTARDLDVSGWVRNEPDGTVSAHLEGDADRLDQMIARMHDGPPAARVEQIDVVEAVPEELGDFRRR